MKRAFKLENLDCAHCAAKMEDAIGKIDGVDSANIAFMTQRLTIETEDDMERILDEAQKRISVIEPDCRIKR